MFTQPASLPFSNILTLPSPDPIGTDSGSYTQ